MAEPPTLEQIRAGGHRRNEDMVKIARDRVAVTHPSGRPTVLVSPSRAVTLRARGYRSATTGTITTPDGGSEPAKLNRKDLTAEAKALGVPVKGTNEELAAAIAAART